MGGSYIGISFLALVHIPIFLIKAFYETMKRKKETNSKTNPETLATEHTKTFLNLSHNLRVDNGFLEWENMKDTESKQLAEISKQFFISRIVVIDRKYE